MTIVDKHPPPLDYNDNPKFKIGDKVYKPKGSHFSGTIRAVFTINNGEWRYVVQTEGEWGLLRIFNGDQLELEKIKK